jgi:hypothetical protein
MRTTAIAILLLLALSACGDDTLSGAYGMTLPEPEIINGVQHNAGDWVSFMTFSKDGKLKMSEPGGGESFDGSYKVEKGKVYITLNGETMVVPLDKDGCLDYTAEYTSYAGEEAGVGDFRMCKKP